MLTFSLYDQLSEDARFIRQTVFVEEQGFKQEFDDLDAISKHIVLYEDHKAAAACRYYWNEEINSYIIGRIAVLKESRGKKFGEKLIQEAERQIKKAGGKTILIGAQQRAAGFYQKSGYRSTGEEYLDENCPHVKMIKNLV